MRSLQATAREQPLLPKTRESLHSNKDPVQPKINKIIKKKKKKQCLTSIVIILSDGQKPPLISSYLIDVYYNQNQAEDMKI